MRRTVPETRHTKIGSPNRPVHPGRLGQCAGLFRWRRRRRSEAFLGLFWNAVSLEEVQHELATHGAREPFSHLSAHALHATRLHGPFPELIAVLATAGNVMALTRNEAAVHERDGTYLDASVDGHVGLVLGPDIDLRIFYAQWAHGFFVEEKSDDKTARSLQFFDAQGNAVHKVFERGTTDGAGACLVSRGKRDDDELIVVVLGSTSPEGRYVDSKNLYRFAWNDPASYLDPSGNSSVVDFFRLGAGVLGPAFSGYAAGQVVQNLSDLRHADPQEVIALSVQAFTPILLTAATFALGLASAPAWLVAGAFAAGFYFGLHSDAKAESLIATDSSPTGASTRAIRGNSAAPSPST